MKKDYIKNSWGEEDDDVNKTVIDFIITTKIIVDRLVNILSKSGRG